MDSKDSIKITRSSEESIKSVSIDEVKLKKIKERLDGLEKGLDKANEDLKNRQTETIGILAIFITLFTFISVNVTIFTKVTDLMTAFVFMILMTICSTFILSFSLMVLNQKTPNRITCLGLILSIIALSLVALIIFLVGWNPSINVITK